MWAVRPDCGAACHTAMDVNGRKTNCLTEVLIAETVHASTEVAKSDLAFFQVTSNMATGSNITLTNHNLLAILVFLNCT